MSSTRVPKLPRVHKHTLIEMNFPVFTARRDAAHVRTLELLREEIPNGADGRRMELYAVCERLLNEAILSTQRSQIQQDSPLLRYLQLLRDTIGLNLVLLRHELLLAKEAKALSKLVTDQTFELRKIDDGFCTSEKHLLGCIDSLIRFGEPLLTGDTADRLKSFHPDDLRRYQLAHLEYTEFYRKTVVLDHHHGSRKTAPA